MSIKVETFSSPGCGRCAQARDTLKAVVEELGEKRATWRDVNILEEMDYAVELGILSPPAIAIDGELVFPALPSPNRLRAELIKRLGRRASLSTPFPDIANLDFASWTSMR